MSIMAQLIYNLNENASNKVKWLRFFANDRRPIQINWIVD